MNIALDGRNDDSDLLTLSFFSISHDLGFGFHPRCPMLQSKQFLSLDDNSLSVPARYTTEVV